MTETNKKSTNLKKQFTKILKEKIEDIEYIEYDKDLIKPYSVDFYFPKEKIAIEIANTHTNKYIGRFNSQLSNEEDENIYVKEKIGVKEKDYHYQKFKACDDKGIELITIFDWSNIDKIVDLIKNKSRPSSHIIYARKVNVEYANTIAKEHRDFLNDFHVLGEVKNKTNKQGSSFVLEIRDKGISFDNGFLEQKLLAIAVYYPTSNKHQVELKRLAFREDYTIIGGASKLVKNVFKYKPEYNEIMTFSDNNLGTGSVYKIIGFKQIEDNKYSMNFYNPEYKKLVKETSLWAVGADRLLQRFPNYKHVGIGEDLPGNKEIVMQYGFYPIYDCGYRKWIYEKK